MNNTGKTIAKNAGVLMGSQLVTWALTLTLTIFLPRILGAEGVGQLHLAESIWAIVGIFLSFGMDTHLTKVVSRIPEKGPELLGLSIILRSGLFVVGFLGVVVYVRLIGYESLTADVIYIYGAGRLILEVGGAATAVLVGLERMEFMAVANILSRVIATSFTILFLLLGYGVIAAVTVFVGASLVGLMIQLLYLGRLQPIRFTFNTELARGMLRASLPYLFVMMFSVMYMNLDAIIISFLVDEETLGWYAGSDRLFGTMMFVPFVFITAVFPALSRLNIDSPEELQKLMHRSFNLLLIIGVPVGFGLFSLADELVVFLYGGDFVHSGPVLTIMGLVLIFTYQNILIGRFLIAVDRQNTWTFVMAVATAATIPLDFIFIPMMYNLFGNGAIGGAVSYFITEICMTIVGLHYLPRGSINRRNLWVAVRVVLAGLIMAALVWPVRDFFIIIPVVVGGIVYATLIIVFRVITDAEKLLVKKQVVRFVRHLLSRRSQPVGIES